MGYSLALALPISSQLWYFAEPVEKIKEARRSLDLSFPSISHHECLSQPGCLLCQLLRSVARDRPNVRLLVKPQKAGRRKPVGAGAINAASSSFRSCSSLGGAWVGPSLPAIRSVYLAGSNRFGLLPSLLCSRPRPLSPVSLRQPLNCLQELHLGQSWPTTFALVATFLAGASLLGRMGLQLLVEAVLPQDFEDKLRFILDNPGGGSSYLLGEKAGGPAKVFDCKGVLLGTIGKAYEEPVRLEDTSHWVWKALVAAEDKNFFHHRGVDPLAVLRSIMLAGAAGRLQGGGSTITQQLVKNLFLTTERTLQRKMKEMVVAAVLDSSLEKRTILELYLNKAYWGHGCYGIRAAARKYFNKHPSSLDLGEATLLVGMLPSPEIMSPFRALDRTLRARRWTLLRMAEVGYISRSHALWQARVPSELQAGMLTELPYRAPYFVDEVVYQLGQEHGDEAVASSGWRIHTTVDVRWQENAECLLQNSHILKGKPQAALVAIEPGTGAVRTLIGGKDYATSQFNRATRALRSPGSTFKPIVFLTAFAEGHTLTRRVADSRAEFEDYVPQNYDNKFHGRVTLESALVQSFNVPTVKLCDELGTDKVIEMAHALGITTPLSADLSLGLGGCELTPFEITTAYATMASGGVYADPHLVTRIEAADGKTLWEHRGESSQVVEPDAVARIHHALQNVVAKGTGKAAWIGRPVAGKTGTSDDNKDVWFAGYTPQLACSVWVGNDDNKPLSRLTSAAGGSCSGSTWAAPLWASFMAFAHCDLPIQMLNTLCDDFQSRDQDRIFCINHRQKARRDLSLADRLRIEQWRWRNAGAACQLAMEKTIARLDGIGGPRQQRGRLGGGGGAAAAAAAAGLGGGGDGGAGGGPGGRGAAAGEAAQWSTRLGRWRGWSHQERESEQRQRTVPGFARMASYGMEPDAVSGPEVRPVFTSSVPDFGLHTVFSPAALPASCERPDDGGPPACLRAADGSSSSSRADGSSSGFGWGQHLLSNLIKSPAFPSPTIRRGIIPSRRSRAFQRSMLSRDGEQSPPSTTGEQFPPRTTGEKFPPSTTGEQSPRLVAPQEAGPHEQRAFAVPDGEREEPKGVPRDRPGAGSPGAQVFPGVARRWPWQEGEGLHDQQRESLAPAPKKHFGHMADVAEEAPQSRFVGGRAKDGPIRTWE